MDSGTPGSLNTDQDHQDSAAQEVIIPAGVKHVRLRIDSPENLKQGVTVEVYSPNGQVLGQHYIVNGQAGIQNSAWKLLHRPVAYFSTLVRAFAATSEESLTKWLILASLAIYLIIRLVALPDFPIYFFTDEAVQTTLAADFLRDRLHGQDREFLPTFFQNGSQYNLGISVYLQVIPYYFFGKSIWVTRGTASLVTLLAAVSVGLTMKNILKNPYPWLAVIFLSITPVWFLHSRTAFETSLSTSFYAVLLYCYLRYRYGNPNFLYGAVISGALAFYSYSSARIVVPVTALLFFIVDWRYHWSQREIVFRAFGLALLVSLPFVRFLITQPEASRWQMRLLGSIWIADVSFAEKVLTTLREYLRGLDPLYWYLPQDYDLPRHTMLGYGHLLRPSLPLVIVGFIVLLRNLRSPAYRSLLVVILAAPAGAAIVRLGVTRALYMVIPAAILTAVGVSTILEWFIRRYHFSRKIPSAIVFAFLALANGYMLYDALVHGPLWYRNYGLAGMQYGARQVFNEIASYLNQYPDSKIVLSPSWANGTDVVARFFFPDPIPFDLGSPAGYYTIARPLDKNQLFVMIPEEYDDLPRNYFSEIQVDKILPYPDGQPGFYFVRLKYASNIHDLIASELRQRRELETTVAQIGDRLVIVKHTKLDIGEFKHIIDGNPDTLVRSWAVNPMLLDIKFDVPQSLQGLSLRVGGTATEIKIQILQVGNENPVDLYRQLTEEPLPRWVTFDLPAEQNITSVKIEILNTNDPSDGHVHLWELAFE